MAEPLYRQIADDLRRRIETGQLPPGAQLLAELALREQYQTSRNTVRDAVKWLITRGLVEIRPGQGTFVTRRDHAVRHHTDRRPRDRVRRRGRQLPG